MTLREKQSLFVILIAKLIDHAYAVGYDMTFGECWRSPEEAVRLAKAGKGVKNSLHCSRLAIDFNLFLNGKYLTKTEEYADLGLWWEAQSGLNYECVWGGRFNDGNHFSIAYGGRK